MVLWIIVYITTFTVMLGMHAYIPNSGVCRVIDDISMHIAQIILRAILVAFDFVRLVIEYTTLVMRALWCTFPTAVMDFSQDVTSVGTGITRARLLCIYARSACTLDNVGYRL